MDSREGMERVVDCYVNYPLCIDDAASALPLFVAVVSALPSIPPKVGANLSISGRCAVDDAPERP